MNKITSITHTPLCWEIWLADIPKLEERIKSHRQYGIRPILITSNNMGNKTSTEVNILPLTSKIKNNIPVHVNILPDMNNGLMEESVLIVENPDTIPKTCLIKKIGVIKDHQTMVKIKNAIMMQQGIFAV